MDTALAFIQTIATLVTLFIAWRALQAGRDTLVDAREARREEHDEAAEARAVRERERVLERSRLLGEIASVVHDLRYAIYNAQHFNVELWRNFV